MKAAEPLKEEASHFVHCIRTGERPLSDSWHGLQVVRILESLSRSLRKSGTMQYLAPVQDDGREPLMVSVSIAPEVAVEH